MVCREACQRDQFVTVLRVFNRTELEYVSVDLLSLIKLLWLILRESRECLDDTLQDSLLDLTKERCILECLTGDIQRQVVG